MSERIPKPMIDGLARQAAPREHPSADLLTAFTERTLSERDRLPIADHLSRCAMCREVVYLASGDIEVPARARSREVMVAAAASRRWTSRWLWAAPVAAIVLVGFGFLLRERFVTVPGRQAVASKTVAEAPAHAPEVQQPAPVPQASGAVSVPTQSGKSKSAAKAETPVIAKKDGAPGPVVAQNQAAMVAKDNRELSTKLEAPEARDASSAMAARRPTAEAAAAAPPVPRANGFAGSKSEAEQAYAISNSLTLSMNRAAGGAVGGMARNQRSTWRISPEGHLEHVVAGSWTRALPEQSSAFRVVSVIGGAVWAGGNDGMLCHSADNGANWSKVALATTGGVETAAIVSIRFDDARRGVVVTDTGASYNTTDGGTSWTKQ